MVKGKHDIQKKNKDQTPICLRFTLLPVQVTVTLSKRKTWMSPIIIEMQCQQPCFSEIILFTGSHY